MSQLENYKKITDTTLVDELYEKFSLTEDYHRSERNLIDSFKKVLFFESLTDDEKIEFRLRELDKKKIFKAAYSDSIIKYEECVIELTKLIMVFLNTDNSADLFQPEIGNEITSTQLMFIRLRTILKVELICLNRHMKLSNGGHVPFHEIVEPIFIELQNLDYYEKYNLGIIKNIYKEVQELFDKKPYEA